jgi:hypothetical protein
MAPLQSRYAVVLLHLDLRIPQSRNQSVIVKTSQRRMRLPRRTKILFDPKMNLHRPALKPASATFRQLSRFRHFLHSEQLPIEGARTILPTRGYGQLHVINRAERISCHKNHVVTAGTHEQMKLGAPLLAEFARSGDFRPSLRMDRWPTQIMSAVKASSPAPTGSPRCP